MKSTAVGSGAMGSAAAGVAIIALVLTAGLASGPGDEGAAGAGMGAVWVIVGVAVGLAFIGGGVAMRARARGAARAATGYTSLRWVHHDGPEREAPFVVDVEHGEQRRNEAGT